MSPLYGINIYIFSSTGENAITAQDGQSVFEAIKRGLDEMLVVTVDFDRVKIITSQFLSAAIGQTVRDYSPNFLNEYLKIVNLSTASRNTLRYVIENAKTWYNTHTGTSLG